jgi:hypothetical protein
MLCAIYHDKYYMMAVPSIMCDPHDKYYDSYLYGLVSHHATYPPSNIFDNTPHILLQLFAGILS